MSHRVDTAPPTTQVLKQDAFGRIVLEARDGGAVICRDLAGVRLPLRWLARRLAAREAAALKRLADLECVPRLLSWDGCRLERGYLAGAPMQEGRPRDPAYFRRARRLLRQLHARGIAHNDLAKEPNWLVTSDGAPALVDFQIASCGDPRSRWLRLLAREDLRHLLKHKRTYCPERLTPVERRLLARPSWLRALWFRTGKPIYRFVTRRLLHWQDDEGRHTPLRPKS